MKGKGNVHEEGMTFGSRPSNSKNDEWVEEEFGTPQSGPVGEKRASDKKSLSGARKTGKGKGGNKKSG